MSTFIQASSLNPYRATDSRETTEPPKKYIKIDGVRQLNPEYKIWQERQGKQATTVESPSIALPIVSNMDEHQTLREVSTASGSCDIPLAPATDAAIEMLQERDISSKIGLSPDGVIDSIGQLFAKYEIPMGLMNKLLDIQEYQAMEFLIDDSGSMGSPSFITNAQGQKIRATRWEEAKAGLKELIEILSYIPTPPIKISFLNRGHSPYSTDAKYHLTLQRQGETPDRFIAHAYRQIDAAFAEGPSGGTPAKDRIIESFRANPETRTLRYLFCDGVPNGGKRDVEEIKTLLKNRQNPENSPFTFFSCSDREEDTEWMREVEEVALYCAESDDFETERAEVAKDQGKALPYSRGFYLISRLVMAINPEDLDAMDESVPLTKKALDNLLGIENSPEEYRHYFDEFKLAQSRLEIKEDMDRTKKGFNWEPHFHDFTLAPLSRDIPAAREFKLQLNIGRPPAYAGTK